MPPTLDLTDLAPNGMHPVQGSCSLAMSIGTLNVQAVAAVAAMDVPRPALPRESDTDRLTPSKQDLKGMSITPLIDISLITP